MNSIATVASGGLEYEADQTHAEILMKYMGIDEGSKGVVTQGATAKGGQYAKGDKNESKLRAVVASGNHLGQDRMDTQHAAKEISRFTPKPEEQDWRAARRLARYLKDHRKAVLEYKYQELPKKVVAWSDADFASCGTPGSHCLKSPRRL